MSSCEKTPIVIDQGSGWVKAGFSSSTLPSLVIPTQVEKKNQEKSYYLFPIEHGIVTNWDAMEKLWSSIFSQLGALPEHHPVLITEAMLGPKANREKLAEIMFEKYHSQSLLVAIQAVLTLIASGRTTGIVWESGDGISHSCPIYEGYLLPHAVNSFYIGGQVLTDYLHQMLINRGIVLTKDTVRKMKEEICDVSLNFENECQSTETDYTLPDGNILHLGSERIRCPEALFQPELVENDRRGIQFIVNESIMKCDIDIRNSLYQNIVFGGGNTLFPTLGERFQKELKAIVAPHHSNIINIITPKERKYSAWIGGTVLANRAPTEGECQWVTTQDYEEFGISVIHQYWF
jgi:actin-related protein